MDLPESPWSPVSVEVTDVALELVDGARVSPPVTWQIEASRLWFGPEVAGVRPAGAELSLADGTVSLQSRSTSGKTEIEALFRNLDLRYFRAYTAERLARAGLSLDGGRLTMRVSAELAGSDLAASGDAQLEELAFSGAGDGPPVSKRVANAATKWLGGQEDALVFNFNLAGDLDDPSFEPGREIGEDAMEQLIGRRASQITAGIRDGGRDFGVRAKRFGDRLKTKLDR